MQPGSECSSAMLLLRNNRRPQGNTRGNGNQWRLFRPDLWGHGL